MKIEIFEQDEYCHLSPEEFTVLDAAYQEWQLEIMRLEVEISIETDIVRKKY